MKKAQGVLPDGMNISVFSDMECLNDPNGMSVPI
jgi:hypothetical protein